MTDKSSEPSVECGEGTLYVVCVTETTDAAAINSKHHSMLCTQSQSSL